MAKSNKPTPKPKATAPAAISPKAETAPTNWLQRPPVLNERDPFLQKWFYGISAFAFVLFIALSLGAGVNADDKFQVDYSQKLVNYYGTFGKDTAALNIPDGNMHLYGGFFEIVTGFGNKMMGWQPSNENYHHLRHVSIAICGWVTLFCVGLFARLIAGWQAGIIALVIMLFSPRFVGDSGMNPKDIPFAMGYMMTIYNMAAVLNKMPRPARWNIVGLILGLAISLSVRAGGMLNFAYLFFFSGLFIVLQQGFAGVFKGETIKRYGLIIGGSAVFAYFLAVLFWPFALQRPLSNPLFALQKFSDLEIAIRVLYEGVNVKSDMAPWHYPLRWIGYTIPLAALLGFVGAFALLPRLLRQYQPLWVFLAIFACVFPVFYVIYKKSTIHDGWRHLTFAYPTLVVCAALFWNELSKIFEGKKAVQYAVIAGLGLTMADAAWFIAANPQMPYVYFNPIKGGTKGAYGYYETDYWGVSIRQGVEWMEKQGILKEDMSETVVIATNMFYPLRQYVSKYGDKVKLKYLKWEKRYDDAWDYGLYPTRFINGSALQKGFWPTDNTIHTIYAGGAPILAIMQNKEKNAALGMASLKVNDANGAIGFFKRELEQVPDNELAWVNLGQAYMNINSLDSAKWAAEKCIEISPDDMQANNMIGLYWLNKNDGKKAKEAFTLALKREPSNPGACYYLAIIAQAEGNNTGALNYIDKAIQLSPNLSPAYELAAKIYESMGNAQQAQRIRAAMPK